MVANEVDLAHGRSFGIGMRIGVLALQGAFVEHEAMLRRLGAETREVRLPSELENLDGLILPGGESTTIGKLLVAYDLQEPLRRKVAQGFPIYGTCAGMILLAKEVDGGEPALLRAMDIAVQRNAFGRQIDSFQADLEVPALGGRLFPAIFIRAPLIRRCGRGVDVLASLPKLGVVAARQGNMLASAFHPELSSDARFHAYFMGMVEAARATR